MVADLIDKLIGRLVQLFELGHKRSKEQLKRFAEIYDLFKEVHKQQLALVDSAVQQLNDNMTFPTSRGRWLWPG